MTKSELLKYIDTLLTQRSDGNIGLLMVRQYVSENMEDMPSAHPTQKNDSNTLEALDCVSRNAAIDALRSYYDEADTQKDSNEERIEQLPSAQPERQWIPCSEKMPDKCGMYWVCTKGGYQLQAELTVNMGGRVEEPWIVWALPFGFPKTEVVAWMPLPEVWKGEEKC